MYFLAEEFYHVYNRGNNKQIIFFKEENHIFFLKKIRDQLLPLTDIVAYCLMPNHFHLLLRPTENGLKGRKSFGGSSMQELSYRIGILLSSYSQAINKQNNTTGSLFQQKTKAKILYEESNGSRISYFEQCFHYIHQNPVAARIVKDAVEWPYSSYRDYVGLRNGTLCSKEVFYKTSGLTEEAIKNKTGDEIDGDIIEKLF